jgi:hypothetical protein
MDLRRSLACVVMIAKARIHSPEVRFFQFSQAAVAKRAAILTPDRVGLLHLWPFIAFHWNKPSTGTIVVN